MIYENKDYNVQYCDNALTKKLVFDKLIEFYKTHQAFNGESIIQSDNIQIEAPELLADIADEIIKFDVTFKD